MKKLILKSIAAVAVIFSISTAAQAQVSFSLNIGSQPAWGPAGYNHVSYYYLPDIESYYDVATGQYIYDQGGRWIYSRELPPRYRGYDLYSGYKVVVNRPRPYQNFAHDRVTYAKYRNWHGTPQHMLRDDRAGGNRGAMSNNGHGNNMHNNGRNSGYARGNAGRNGNMNPGQGNNHAQHNNGRMQQGQNAQQGHDDHGHDDHGHH